MFASASARHRARPKLARRLAVLGAALILGGVSVGITTTAASAATAYDASNVSGYAAETFTNATVSGVQAPAVPNNGSATMTNSACLTAASGTGTASGATIPGCATQASNTAGNGALRLTGAGTDLEGGVGATGAVPTGQGLDVTFNSYQYGGSSSSADGIVFYLATTDPYDPNVPTKIGAKGGSLGYSASYYSDATNGTPGLANGYLGFGLDAFGNFRQSTYQGKDCAASAQSTSVSVRGPGNGVNGYCLLTPDADTVNAPTKLAASNISGGTTGTRANSGIPVEVVVNTSGTDITSSGFGGALTPQTVKAMHWAIIVKPLGQRTTKTVSGVLPSLKTTTSAGVPSDWYDPTTGLPYKLTYGWVASTGGFTDIHEINQFTATSANGRTPVLGGTADVSDVKPQRGTAGTYTVHPTVTSTGGAELGKVRISTSFGSGVTPRSGTFTAGSYSCTTSGQDVVCTTPSAVDVDAGKALPDLAIPYTSTGEIGATVTVSTKVASTDSQNTATTGAELTVAKTPSATSTTTTAPEPVAGQTTTVTAHVVGAPSRGTTAPTTAPTGSVTFSEGSTVLCPAVPLDGGAASCDYAPATKGDHVLSAAYSGDASWAGSTTSQTITATARPTTFGVSVDKGQVEYSQPVTVTAALPQGAGGTVTFSARNTDGGTPIVLCADVPTTAASCTTDTLPVGSYEITATYSGDSANDTATATTSVTVAKITSKPGITFGSEGDDTGSTTYGTGTALDTTGIASGRGVANAATGAIEYSIDRGDGTTWTCTVPLGDVATTCTTPADLHSGTYTVTSHYSGDDTHAEATTSATLTVAPAATTITATVGTSDPTYGAPVTLSTNGLPSTATGTVAFRDTTTDQLLCTATVAHGAASCPTTAPLGAGDHTVAATWDGDADHEPSTSAPLTLTVAKAETAISATVNGAPGAAAVEYGTRATVRADLPADADPTSTVTFTDRDGKALGTAKASDPTWQTSATQDVGDLPVTVEWAGDSNHQKVTTTATVHVTLATVRLGQTVNDADTATITRGDSATLEVSGLADDATGTVTYSTTGRDGKPLELGQGDASKTGAPLHTDADLLAATYTVTATYSGDERYSKATAPTVTLTVAKATPTLTGTVGGSADGATTTYGEPTTLTVGDLPQGATGTVVFTTGTGDDSIELCRVTLPATSCQTPADLPAGDHEVTVTYNGDDDHTPNTTSEPLHLTVEQASAPITVTASTTTPTYGTAVALTAGGLPANATGEVTFRDGKTVLCTATIGAAGTASCTPAELLGAGDHEVTATWSGDANHLAVTSAAVTVSVAKAAGTVGGTVGGAAKATISYGETTTIAATGLPAGVDRGSVLHVTDGAGIDETVTAAKPTTTTPDDLEVGTHTITISWDGDANHTGTTATVTLVVEKADVTLTGTVNEKTEATIAHGTTADLAVDGLPEAATGDLAFTTVKDGATIPLRSVAITSTTVEMTTSKKLPVGDWPITATWAGDSHHNAAKTTVRLLIAKPTLTIGTATDTTTYGVPTTVTVSGPADGVSGTLHVTAVRPGDTVPTLICDLTLPADAITCPTPDMLGAGTWAITATYIDDDGTVSSADAPASLEVKKAATSVGVSGGTGTGSTPEIPGTYGTPVTLTPTGLPAGATGTVEFKDGDTTLCTVTLGTDTSCTTPADLPVGSHTVTPVYSGDDDHEKSTGDPVTIVVAQAPSALTLTASPSHVWGSSTLLTIGGLAKEATGSVVLSAGDTEICTIALPDDSCSTDVIEPGTVTVTARWDGDASFLGSSATAPVTVTAIHTVNPTHVQSSSRTSGQAVWPAITGAASYQVVIGTDEDLSTGTRTITITAPLTSAELEELTAETTYWYRVTAVSPTGTVLSTHDAVLVTAAPADAGTPSDDPTGPTTPSDDPTAAAPASDPTGTATASATPAPAPAPEKTLQIGQLAFTGPTVDIGMIGFGALLMLLAGALLLLARRLREEEQGPIGPLRKG